MLSSPNTPIAYMSPSGCPVFLKTTEALLALATFFNLSACTMRILQGMSPDNRPVDDRTYPSHFSFEDGVILELLSQHCRKVIGKPDAI